MDMSAFPTLFTALADARRTGDGEAFANAEKALKALLALAQSRIDYECAMRYYDIAVSSTDKEQQEFLLQHAAHSAQRSLTTAAGAGDKLGVLYAEMITGGHILPAQERLNEAVLLLRDVLAAATALEGQVAEEEIPRLQNLLMNLLLHLLDHSITLRGVSTDQVRDWLTRLQSNSLFTEEKRALYGRILQKAVDYCIPSS